MILIRIAQCATAINLIWLNVQMAPCCALGVSYIDGNRNCIKLKKKMANPQFDILFCSKRSTFLQEIGKQPLQNIAAYLLDDA
ncbi:hypothetical protein REPUB_Repub05bG0067600 [Reevesia pubescens]